ncbi:PREDICTED: globulin-1 S allele-like [Ipomoea nil]|uniref:globulin-1 S allele-like n=1 Tax=Ipomoea nil TaxID=35883 RepID=UPI0009014502|nr:PREDICTED: globulin-1 S allele-like [Ipomoea nil]
MILKTLGFVVFFALAAVALGTADPELETCRHQCRVQMAFDRQQREACLDKCERYIQEKEGRQEERGGGSSGRREEEGRGGEDDNPYVFQPRHFRTAHRSQQGRFSVLPRFTERSNQFEGIENFRFGILEVESKTFVAPNHLDADLIGLVAEGEGTLDIIQKNKKKSYDIRVGSIVFIPAGATSYLVNTDNNNKLVIIKLIQTISTPGRFEFFFGTGRNSFLRAFKSSILEAAYDESKETIQRVLRGRDDSPFIQVSDEQLKSLRKESDTIWPFKTDKSSSSKPVDIFKHKSVSNNYGQLFEVDNDDFKELGDIEVAFANITRGGMLGPLFNTRATKLAFVVDGKGWAQMACPQVSSQTERSEEGAIPTYETVNAQLRPGTLFVIPPGNPYVSIASQDDNLQIVCFDINADNNERVALAGKNNLYSNMDDVAKEVSFGVSSKLVDKVFENDDDLELFSKGPEWQQSEDRADQ